ncbi:MAG: hypothetical protein ACI4DN_11485 [Lachnospiraceae bacterium]
MSLKHYLRGLGIGILVTAVFFGLTQKAETMTDAEIKIRASQLGMVEETVLADLASEEADIQEEEGKMAETEAEEEENLQTSSEEQTEEDTEENLPEDTEEALEVSPEGSADGGTITTEENGIITQEENYVIITVEKGNGSGTISRKLYDAGMIDSIEEYDKFLISNGYDRKLSAGSHRIPVGSSMEEIARILCGME